MALLYGLAQQYQRALDSLNGLAPTAPVGAAHRALYDAVEDVGMAFCAVTEAAMGAVEGAEAVTTLDLTILEPIIRRTTLAASIATYLERIPWAAVTPQMLYQPTGTPLAALHVGTGILRYLFDASMDQTDDNGTLLRRCCSPALLLRQISVSANLQAGAAAGSAALAALLRAAPQDQLEQCRETARSTLFTFLFPFPLISALQTAGSAAPLVQQFWQRVAEQPLALPATVDALQSCRTAGQTYTTELQLVAAVISAHSFMQSRNVAVSYRGAWSTLLASESFQEYALENLSVGSSSEQPLSYQYSVFLGSPACRFINFLGLAAAERKVNEARLGSVLTHKGILAPLQAMAEGKADHRSVKASMRVLAAAGAHFSEHRRIPGGSPEVYHAASTTLLGALRQLAARMQLRAVAPAQQRRAVRRAQRGGFLQGDPGAEGTALPHPDDAGAHSEEWTTWMLVELLTLMGNADQQSPVQDLGMVMRCLEPALRCELGSMTQAQRARTKCLATELLAASLNIRGPASSWLDAEGATLICTLGKDWGDEAPKDLCGLLLALLERGQLLGKDSPAAAESRALGVAHLLPALIRRTDVCGDPERPHITALKSIWTLIMAMQRTPELIPLLDSRSPEVLRRLMEDPEVVRAMVDASAAEVTFGGARITIPLLHFGLCKEWDYTVLVAADPLTRLLELAETEDAETQSFYFQIVLSALAQLEGAADPLLQSADDAAWRGLHCLGHEINPTHLKPAIAALMAEVSSLLPLSLGTVGAAARLALPQIGCSNLKCRNMAGVSKALLEVQLCAGCKRAQYCSLACQKAEWKQHRPACNAETARLAGNG